MFSNIHVKCMHINHIMDHVSYYGFDSESRFCMLESTFD